jgi:aminoglycoside phosphotransferase (APT) family kinase protein
MNKPVTAVQSMLNTVISEGKSRVRSVSAAEIERFIRSQPGITGPVVISNVRANAEMGASNGIVLFTAQYDDGSGPVTRDLVLRHAPGSETRLFYEYDLARQFRVQRAMRGTGVPVPEALWLDADGAHFGVPGYVMEMIRGTASHTSAFTRGPLVGATPADREIMLDNVMAALVKIHGLDYAALGLGDFVMNAPGETPLERSINWYWQTWDWINLPIHARMVPVRRWLLENTPSGATALTHGDSMLHNYLFNGTEVVAVLDWEMSTLGPPEVDLAVQCLGNEMFAAPPDSGLLRPPSEADWLARYEKAGGRPAENFPFYKKYAVYFNIIAIEALLRHLPPDARAAQNPLTDRYWAVLES